MAAEPVILGDWGSTTLRLWLRQGGVTQAACEGPGVFAAQRSPPEILRATLARLGHGAQSCRIVLCGMAGAREGFAEAGYVSCPAGVTEWVGAAIETLLDGVRVTVLPGFSDRDRRGRADVMRGEEAQVFGALGQQEAQGAKPTTIVLPGTHSKWVRIEQGRILHFATCPTGELRARLLGSSMAPPEGDTDHVARDEGFTAGIDRARDGHPLIAALFEARAAQMLDQRTGDWSRGFLSGLLIGSEIAAMAPSLVRAGCPLLVGTHDLVALYRTAFAQFGLDCRTADGEACVLSGLEMADAELG